MAEIKNFDTDGLFFKENISFIERFYYEHFYLIKAYDLLPPSGQLFCLIDLVTLTARNMKVGHITSKQPFVTPCTHKVHARRPIIKWFFLPILF